MLLSKLICQQTLVLRGGFLGMNVMSVKLGLKSVLFSYLPTRPKIV